MYGFHKCRGDKATLEFRHPLFTRHTPHTHHLIERKRSSDATLQLASLMHAISFASMEDTDPMKDIEPVVPPVPQELEAPEDQTSFRLNSSEMTIRLNEKLTSLCDVEWNEAEDER
jgi:hypothetical protein